MVAKIVRYGRSHRKSPAASRQGLITKCPGLDRLPGLVGPGLAVKWIEARFASRPWGFFVRVLAQASLGSDAHEKAPTASRQGFITKCPGLDSNQHSLSATRPSSVRVYQFHHLGRFAVVGLHW